MLIHGLAGSGKSTAARKIEEYLWMEYKEKLINTDWDKSDAQNLENPPFIPIFVSLPALKDPVFNAIEETLQSEFYYFDKLLINEFRELSNKLQLILIMDSYDELK